MRPVLLPALRRVWRDRETLQLGRPPGRSVVLAGVDDAVRGVLGLLDGTRDAAQVLRDAEALGCPRDRTTALLGLLDGGGLLADAAVPVVRDLPRARRDRLAGDVAALSLSRGTGAGTAVQRRARARVGVVGGGRVGAVVAGLLAASGVGALRLDDDGPTGPGDLAVGGLDTVDLGRPRGQAVRDRLRALAPDLELDPPDVDLLVLAPVAPLVPGAPAPAAPHLLAEVRDGTGTVGPAVLPGTSACLRCLELTRTDLDPDWPALVTQLSSAPAVPAGSAALAAAVAAQAAAQVLGLLDGWPLPAAVGGTLELVPPDWRWRRRSWAPHPHCGCVRSAG